MQLQKPSCSPILYNACKPCKLLFVCYASVHGSARHCSRPELAERIHRVCTLADPAACLQEQHLVYHARCPRHKAVLQQTVLPGSAMLLQAQLIWIADPGQVACCAAAHNVMMQLLLPPLQLFHLTLPRPVQGYFKYPAYIKTQARVQAAVSGRAQSLHRHTCPSPATVGFKQDAAVKLSGLPRSEVHHRHYSTSSEHCVLLLVGSWLVLCAW